jgi:hypothetical protein
VVSREQILINRVPVKVHSTYEREVVNEAGHTVGEMEAAIIVRGRMPNNQFQQLITSGRLTIEYMDGPRRITMAVTVAEHGVATSGDGEGAVYRHDLRFRETTESYRRRLEEHGILPKVADDSRAEQMAAVKERASQPAGETRLTSTDPAMWGDAIRQMRGEPTRAVAPEPPLTQTDLVGVETVLVNLRVDALIEQLEAVGLIEPGAVRARGNPTGRRSRRQARRPGRAVGADCNLPWIGVRPSRLASRGFP